jgi:hypothetical protein
LRISSAPLNLSKQTRFNDRGYLQTRPDAKTCRPSTISTLSSASLHKTSQELRPLTADGKDARD